MAGAWPENGLNISFAGTAAAAGAPAAPRHEEQYLEN
jgi:hypothetical protein